MYNRHPRSHDNSIRDGEPSERVLGKRRQVDEGGSSRLDDNHHPKRLRRSETTLWEPGDVTGAGSSTPSLDKTSAKTSEVTPARYATRSSARRSQISSRPAAGPSRPSSSAVSLQATMQTSSVSPTLASSRLTPGQQTSVGQSSAGLSTSPPGRRPQITSLTPSSSGGSLVSLLDTFGPSTTLQSVLTPPSARLSTPSSSGRSCTTPQVDAGWSTSRQQSQPPSQENEAPSTVTSFSPSTFRLSTATPSTTPNTGAHAHNRAIQSQTTQGNIGQLGRRDLSMTASFGPIALVYEEPTPATRSSGGLPHSELVATGHSAPVARHIEAPQEPTSVGALRLVAGQLPGSIGSVVNRIGGIFGLW